VSEYKKQFYWKEEFKGEGVAGQTINCPELVEFIKKVEEQHGEVIGFKFNGTTTIELLWETPQTKIGGKPNGNN
jgi:hypothetical protein